MGADASLRFQDDLPLPVARWGLELDKAGRLALVRSDTGAALLEVRISELPDGEVHLLLESPRLEAAPEDPDLAALLPWAEALGVAALVGRAPHAGRAVLRFDTADAASEGLVRLLGSRGLELVVAEDEMALDLGDPPAAPPSDVPWRPWTAQAAADFFAVYSAAFRERPGFPGWDQATWVGRYTSSPGFRPDLSVLVDHDGRPAAYAICSLGEREGWIVQMGVRPEARGLGLGRRLLSIAAGQLGQAGAVRVLLGVNVNNPGAAALYRSFGFRRIHQYQSYRRALL